MIIVNLDFERLHFDFGSTVVWPKRFELGYAFPLIDNVIYQNNVGDNDNQGLGYNNPNQCTSCNDEKKNK